MPFPLALLGLVALRGVGGAIAIKSRQNDLLARKAARDAEIDALDIGLSSATGSNEIDAEQMETMRKQFATAQSMLKSQDPVARKLGEQMLMDVSQAVRSYQATNETQARGDENTIYQRGREQDKTNYERQKDQREFDYKVAQDNRNFAAQQRAQREALIAQYGNQAWTRFENLNDNLRQASKPFLDQKEAYGRIRAAHADNTPAGDIAMVFNFMKMLDPTSVVRESEAATAENTSGVPGSVRNLYNSLLVGKRLNPEQRDQFLAQADLQYQSAQANQILRNTQAIQQARAGGVPEQLASTLGVPLEMPEVAFRLPVEQQTVDRAMLESMGPITENVVDFTFDQRQAGRVLKSFPDVLNKDQSGSFGGTIANILKAVPGGVIRGMTEFDQQQAARYMAGKQIVQGPDGIYYEQDREGGLKPLSDRDLALLKDFLAHPPSSIPFGDAFTDRNAPRKLPDVSNSGRIGVIKR